MVPEEKTTPTRFAVFVNCNEAEREVINEAARVLGMSRSVSTWARSVLLVEARSHLGTPRRDARPEGVGSDKGASITIGCNEEEIETIRAAAAAVNSFSVSSWARTVLLYEANKVIKKERSA